MGRPKLREPINSDYEIFGKNLATLRKAKNLSQAELARELDLATSSIAEYESGTQRVQLSTIKLFAEYFHVSVDDLIGTNFGPGNLEDNVLFLESQKLTSSEKEELKTFADYLLSKRGR